MRMLDAKQPTVNRWTVTGGILLVTALVALGTQAPNLPPTATITSPAGDVPVNPGQSVSFSGTGTDPVPLTIKGTSGPVTHSVNVTLLVMSVGVGEPGR